MKTLKISILVFGLLAGLPVGFSGNGEKPVKPHISKKDLVKLVDSLLDLEVIDSKEIELISYYNLLITNNIDSSYTPKKINLSELNFYDNYDELLIFPQLNDNEIPDSAGFDLENELLGNYTPPISGFVTSYYGWRDKRMHKGIDIDLNKGDVVVAAFDGKVRVARKKGGFGNVVVIMHPNGLETVYAHLHKFKVKEGDVVLSGQTIGTGGSTGHSTGTHLHFEVRYKGQALNPAAIISFTENKLLDKSVIVKKYRKELYAFPANAQVYKVQRGESWYSILKKYGLNSKQLCALNGTKNKFYLRPGQQIRVN